MTKITEQATLVDMPAVGIKRKLPRLPENHYYVEGDTSPTSRHKVNREHADLLANLSLSLANLSINCRDMVETHTVWTHDNKLSIIETLRRSGNILERVSDSLHLACDLDEGIAVPLPEGFVEDDIYVEDDDAE